MEDYIAMMKLEDEEEEEEDEEMEVIRCIVRNQGQVTKRKWWIHPVVQRRQWRGTYARLIKELELDSLKIKDYFRLSKEQFRYVLTKVEMSLNKSDTRMRKSITPREKLAVTLRFLATGESFKSLAFSYRLGSSTIGYIVKEVCEVIWKNMKGDHMKMPSNATEWKQIADNFETQWQFPNCCGAIDGKHIVMSAPSNSGSVYYNYKGTFSIVLLAAVDANYRFVMIDVGAYGMNNDSGKAMRNGSLSLPPDRPLPGAEELGPLPYVFVADEGLPLLRTMMRPYGGRGKTEEERIFNYRLSRARRIVESAFGILANRWRVFHTKIAVQPETTKHIVKAACVLHNFLQITSTPIELQSASTAASSGFDGLADLAKNIGRSSSDAANVRSAYKAYFNNQGSVSWQTDLVRRGQFTE